MQDSSTSVYSQDLKKVIEKDLQHYCQGKLSSRKHQQLLKAMMKYVNHRSVSDKDDIPSLHASTNNQSLDFFHSRYRMKFNEELAALCDEEFKQKLS